MKYLKVDNLNHLRDQFEEQAFFDKIIKRLGALMVFQKCLNLQMVNMDTLNLKYFQPESVFGENLIDMVVFEFGELPVIDDQRIEKPVLFILGKDTYKYCICGWATTNVIRDHLIEASMKLSNKKNNKNFIWFKYLNHIDNLIKQYS